MMTDTSTRSQPHDADISTTSSVRSSKTWLGSHRHLNMSGAWIIVLGVAAAWLYIQGSSTNLFTFNSCLIAVLGAIGLNLLMGTAGQVSIGNSAFMAVGAFGCVFTMRLGAPFPWDMLAGAVIAAACGAIVGLPALRLRGLHLALATLAAFYIVYYLGTQYELHARGAGSGGFTFNPLFQSRGLVGGQRDWTLLLWAIVSVSIVLAVRLENGKAARAWRLIRDHETAAPAIGIAVTRYKMSAFVLSSGLVGLSGALMGEISGSVSADEFTLFLGISYIAMVVIGGLDSVGGAIAGAFIVTSLPTLVPQVMASVLGAQTAASKGGAIAEVVYGSLVVLFVTVSPEGLSGWATSIVAGARRRLRRHLLASRNRAL